MVISIALLIAIGIGFTLEPVRVCFMVDDGPWIRVIRYIVGMMAAVIVAYGARCVDRVGHAGECIVAPAVIASGSILRCRLVVVFIRHRYCLPRLRLAHSSNEPETPFTVKGAFVKIRKTANANSVYKFACDEQQPWCIFCERAVIVISPTLIRG